ncbi:GNAT family N-acetyltransferase [Psychrobacillus sp. NEAU-3TGS]|uniref:GNAT family N-acetyltransferase n=1 Tax=Psychrobacillus sp. NEAU-3TGS TaxID=2995412 RepID=UPI00249674BF|nr:GNAT family N-acetyltransferase [Psychrobacillus sp. NEAU-3TGS]MDI2587881.1 GNAT family N-acetyltransferase [Psychrobacillus sp. NEAU-3TGS]
MDILIMTVSIPLDSDTMQEVKELLQEDKVNYASLLSVDELTDSHIKGFCVLAYDDESDKLVGVLTSIDRLETGDFEWSAVVSPSIRREGIGTGLVAELDRNLALREATYDLALVPEDSQEAQEWLEKIGYVYDFTERTMMAKAVETEVQSEVNIMPYTSEEPEVMEVLISAFGDTLDEVSNFIAYNTQTPNRKLWIASLESKVVGTFAIVEDLDKLWITGLGVHEQASGKGVATAILEWAKNEAKHVGKASIYLDVEIDNEKALAVYQKAGFETIRHTHYYQKG